MKKFTKEQQENDLRCRIATMIDEKFKYYTLVTYQNVTKVYDKKRQHCHLILSDGKNKSADLLFENGNKYIVNKDDVFMQTETMYPVPCLIEEVEYELETISKYFR